MLKPKQKKLSLVEPCDKANIFLGLIEYELNSILGASHLVDYISVHVQFDLERQLINILKTFRNDPLTHWNGLTEDETNVENS